MEKTTQSAAPPGKTGNQNEACSETATGGDVEIKVIKINIMFKKVNKLRRASTCRRGKHRCRYHKARMSITLHRETLNYASLVYTCVIEKSELAS